MGDSSQTAMVLYAGILYIVTVQCIQPIPRNVLCAAMRDEGHSRTHM